MTLENQLYVALGYCIFMLVLGFIFKKYPPKKINELYGYRTNRSTKNEKTWQAANQFSIMIFIRVCLYSFVLPICSYFLFPNQNILITIIGNTLFILYGMYATERHLIRHFDKDGNPLE